MQGTEHDTSPEAATSAAQAALNGGRPADARARATAALERYGPDPALYTLLGRAHLAENEDDHDDEAERVYRQGLEAFPDDLDLLAAYAGLCLESDALDRPGRHARGPVLAARIIELAPDSPQALHVGRHARGEIMVLPGSGALPKATAAHIQRHDVRAALADTPDLAEAARLAEEQAAEYPYDERLAVRAETLTALTRPGRRLFLAHVRAPLATLLTVTAVAATLTITRAAFHLPGWMSLIAVLLFMPGPALVSLERRAQARGLARLLPPPDEADLPESPLPPPPAIGSRQVAVNLAVLCVMVCAAASPLLWPAPPENTDYPHYTVAPPATVLGAPLLTAVDGSDEGTLALWTETFGNSFSYVYGTVEGVSGFGGRPAAFVFGGTGDLRDAEASLVEGYQLGLAESDSTIDAVWDAPPGARGGRLRCVSYATDLEDKGAHTACSWADRGSLGTVVMNKAGLDHDTAAETARTTRDAILHEDTSGATEASAPRPVRTGPTVRDGA
ncbi:tetratricopeptide repeat protein [Streptomyces sp. NPDC002666]